MRRKIIALLVWIAVSILYCLNIADIGRSIGANVNAAIETYSEMMVKYGGTTTDLEHLGDALTDMISYRTWDNLEDEFKIDFVVISITTVIYVGVSIGCYRMFSTNGKENMTEDLREEICNE